MKYCFIILALLWSQQNYSQCNPVPIFGNDSTHAVCFDIIANVRKCYSNNIPNHAYGPFGGGNTIQGQDFDYSMCLYPEIGLNTTPLTQDTNSQGCANGIIFGITTQGVNLSPFARLYWVNPSTLQENLAWVVEAEFTLNMDLNGGHVNAISRYHYHNVPINYYTDSLNIDGSSHSPIVGYAADGFPIYYKYLYSNPLNPSLGLAAFQSSYSLKTGNRPGDGISAPNGAYDGEYVQDYEYIAALSDLDECGMRYGITPDYPSGTYYYVMTDNWPYIPRCLKGKFVDNSFRLGPNCPISTAATDCSLSATSLSLIPSDLKVEVYPNPSSDYVQIELNSSLAKKEILGVKIYSLDAKMVYFSEILEENINVSNMKKGVYFIQVDFKQGQVTQKIVIQ